MAVAPSMLRQYQWGTESTAGTAVAATSKIGVTEMTFEDDDEVERPPIVRGLLVRTPGVAQPVRRGTRWTARGPVLFEEIHKWMGMVILKDAAPVGTSA